MNEYDYNKMEVYGNRTELEKFMSDVHGDWGSVFCIDNIFDMQDITPDRVKEPFPGLVIYRPIYLKSQLSDSGATLSDEFEYLRYYFTSHYQTTPEICDVLKNNYPNLKFKIFIQDLGDFYRHELEFRGGEYYLNNHHYWEEVPWRANCRKLMLYKEDLIKKTLQVVEEEIICPENDPRFDGAPEFHYDDALLRELEDL
jgi:hypothetical protein